MSYLTTFKITYSPNGQYRDFENTEIIVNMGCKPEIEINEKLTGFKSTIYFDTFEELENHLLSIIPDKFRLNYIEKPRFAKHDFIAIDKGDILKNIIKEQKTFLKSIE